MTAYDIIIWGATGYTGRLACEYLAAEKGRGINWAMAGRNGSKLEALAATLRMKYKVEVPFTTAQLDDLESMKSMCQMTRVLVAMVGPYTLTGEPALRACLETDTHYLDITAELNWVEKMALKYSGEAELRKLKMIPCCGFDFVPNDVMMLQLQRYLADPKMRAVYAPYPREVVHSFCQSTPFVSGGTAHSGVQIVRSKDLREIVKYYTNPYEMCPNHGPDVKTSKVASNMNRYQIFPRRIRERAYYCTPFVMSSLMSKYIHWSNHVQGYPWGRNLVYRGGEKREFGFTAYLYSLILWLQFFLLICLAHLPFLWPLLPTPGEGPRLDPSTDYMESSLIAHIPAEPVDRTPPRMEKTVEIKWRIEGVEAYGAAALFVVEAAKLIACEPNRCTEHFGVLSPSAALGGEYVDRLKRTKLSMEISEF